VYRALTRFLAAHRRLRLLLGVSAVATWLLAIGALAVIGLSRTAPAWWPAVKPADPATLAAAEAVENAVISQLSLARQTEPGFNPTGPGEWRSQTWSVSLSEADANAWLACRLPQWLQNREEVAWPSEVGVVQVSFEEGLVRIGALVGPNPAGPPGGGGVAGRRGGGGADRQVLGASLVPVLRGDGSLWVSARAFQAGRITIPAAWALRRVSDPSAPLIPAGTRELPQAHAVLAALAGSVPAAAKATVRLDGGRRVRLLKIVPRDGRIELTFRTERPATAAE